MKELGTWQIISFVSRMLAKVIGLVQSFAIVRILTVGEWGTVQLAVSIGSALGIYQHLGLASASTREISAAKDESEVFKVFIASTLIRYIVTVPIVIGLFFFADYIAVDLYKNPTLILPLKIFAVTLFVQGFQSILNSVISGTKRFKHLFIYQVAIAFVSVAIFIPLVYYFRVYGHFYAFLLFNIISTIALAFIAFKPLRNKLIMPSKKDFLRLVRDIFSINFAIYLVKIIYINWEKLGNNVLGLTIGAESMAIFAFALLYSKNLMSISDSVTDVNLPVFSEKYVTDIESFKDLFKNNFNKIFVLVAVSALGAAYWVPEITTLFVGSDKYSSSFPLVAPMLMAFIFYSFLNIVNSSVLIPAKLVKEMIASFASMIIGTLLFFIAAKNFMGSIPSMAWGMGVGAFLGYLVSTVAISGRLNFKFFFHDHWLILIQVFVFSLLWWVDGFIVKLLVFVPVMALFIWGVLITKFVSMSDITGLWNKLNWLYQRYVLKKI